MRTAQVKTSYVSGLSCSRCGSPHYLDQIQHTSNCCNHPLIVNYDISRPLFKEDLVGRESNMWRYREMLPVISDHNRITLGEGMTPLLHLGRLGEKFGFSDLWLKDEGQNPTGSFKARGISVAVSRAKELGIVSCVIPTAGNAGGALSAYCAAGGINATVVMPKNAPVTFQKECKFYGADVKLLDGLIDACGLVASKISERTGAFNFATLKEPYRLEGKKTIGYEIAEQMNWQLPDVILFPTGGGTGLIGMWKAFNEMVNLGWIEDRLPKMVVVQSRNCSPLVDCFSHESTNKAGYTGSIANGIVVPSPFGKEMIMRVIRESNGYAISVTDDQIVEGIEEISRTEGLLISPEGAATWMALNDLVSQVAISKHEKILIFNTASGYKYLDSLRSK